MLLNPRANNIVSKMTSKLVVLGACLAIVLGVDAGWFGDAVNLGKDIRNNVHNSIHNTVDTIHNVVHPIDNDDLVNFGNDDEPGPHRVINLDNKEYNNIQINDLHRIRVASTTKMPWSSWVPSLPEIRLPEIKPIIPPDNQGESIWSAFTTERYQKSTTYNPTTSTGLLTSTSAYAPSTSAAPLTSTSSSSEPSTTEINLSSSSAPLTSTTEINLSSSSAPLTSTTEINLSSSSAPLTSTTEINLSSSSAPLITSTFVPSTSALPETTTYETTSEGCTSTPTPTSTQPITTTEAVVVVESQKVQRSNKTLLLETLPKEMLMGSIIAKDQVPFVAGVEYNREIICGGVIVSQEYIFSAAQCFSGKNIDDISIIVGSSASKSFSVVSVKKVWIHECYDHSTKYHDVALVKLASPLEYSKGVSKVKLPKVKHNAEAFINGSIIGSHQGSLTYNKVKVLELKDCANYHNVITNQMCVHQIPTPGNCATVPGLPFIQKTAEGKTVLAGLGSYTGEDCSESPSVVTRINKYGKWISNIVQGKNVKIICN